MAQQAYGYSYLPLLLSLAAPPLAILLPNPLPPSTPASVAGAKYPYTSLRKSLRLLIEGNESLDELENDISYVYSGYAPISIRLVQCVAQKGGVLSNPAKSKEAGTEEGSRKGKSTSLGQVQAHPIVGFKGFEDVLEISVRLKTYVDQCLPQEDERQPVWCSSSAVVRTRRSLLFDGQAVRLKVN